MDRRGNPETAEHNRDDRLQKALDVILESYKGGAPEGLYRDAIASFEALMEISRTSEVARDFSHRKGIDLKYLVDGANFVISRMHFNSENNYYITLGLPRNAHQEEIRERWKRLMMLYHPDRQVGSEDWVSERAKKVNEAYSVLKDEQKRSAYDHQLAAVAHKHESVLQKSGHSTKTGPRRSPRSSPPDLSDSPLRPLRKYFTRILIALYVVFILAVIGFIYLRNLDPDIESRLVPDQKAGPILPQQRPVLQEMSLLPDQGRAGKEREQFVRAETLKEVPEPKEREAARQPGAGQKEPAAEISRMQRKRVAAGDSAATAITESPEVRAAAERKPADLLPSHLLKPVVPLSSSPLPARPEELKQVEQKKELLTKAGPPQPVQIPEAKTAAEIARPEARPLQDSKVQSPAGALTRQEVEEFMQRYVKAYEKGDLDQMMSLFSRSAVENNVLRYREIRDAYRLAFEGKLNTYLLRDLEIRIDGTSAHVAGVYNISRYASADDRWMKFNGRISWKLVRESDALKIISLNYDK